MLMCKPGIGAAIAIAFIAVVGPTRESVAAPLPDMAKYDFLEGSKWFVPHSTLPAITFDLATGTASAIVDQTVWDITHYRYGYFWGRTVAELRDAESGELLSEPSCMHLVGSVTPRGQVHITFINQDQPTALTATRGTGWLVWHGRTGWRFEEMQMSAGMTSVVVHWSFMEQCKPGQTCEAQLPGTDSSLWDLLDVCER